MKRVVSVGPGSSTRNHRYEAEWLGQRIALEKIGTDGDLERANRVLRELDGKVDAFGLANINLHLHVGGRRYLVRDAARMIRGVSKTPVVDGGGVKQTWEHWLITDYLPNQRGISFRGKKVLLVSSVDRYWLVEAFIEAGAEVICGDFIFALGLPIPIRSIATVRFLAALLLPIFTKLPFRYLYPIGKSQEEIVPRHGKFYAWADVIAGDFHYIRRHMPHELRGKIILSQTITATDVDELKKREVWLLVADFESMGGRSFATNVLQGAVVALLGKQPEAITPQEYMDTLLRVGITPRVQELTPTVAWPGRQV